MSTDRRVRRPLRWTDAEGRGLERCLLILGDAGLTLEGVVAGTRDGKYGAHYAVRADAGGRTRELRLRHVGGPELHLTVDDGARWRDAVGGAARPERDGCLDVNLGTTPATDARPTSRLRLASGEGCAVPAGCVPLASEIAGDVLPRPADQRYTRRADRLWRDEGLFRSFTADPAADDMGPVLDHPVLFRHLRAATPPRARPPAQADRLADEAGA